MSTHRCTPNDNISSDIRRKPFLEPPGFVFEVTSTLPLVTSVLSVCYRMSPLATSTLPYCNYPPGPGGPLPSYVSPLLTDRSHALANRPVHFCKIQMTTSYVCKRCRTLGFSKGFKYLDMKYSPEELSEDNVLYIGDERTDDSIPEDEDQSSDYPWRNHPISINDIQYVDNTRKPLVVVELARRKRQMITVPVTSPNDKDIINNLKCPRLKLEDEDINEFKSAIITYLDDNSYLSDKQLSNEFITFISQAYTSIKDGANKLALIRLLNNNNVNTDAIETSHPIRYQEVEDICVIPTDIFDDIKIVINKADVNASSSSAIYRHNPDDLKKAAVGNSTQLEAFSKNKFTVIHNKKSANIENRILKRNHDVLDSLARNGVVCSPNTEFELSIHRLMKALKRFKEFDIVFIHPSYDLKINRAEYPSELIEPAYIINEGELLAVVYRYISINYFGYCSVYNEEMKEFSYLI